MILNRTDEKTCRFFHKFFLFLKNVLMSLLTTFIKRLIEGAGKDVFTCCLREIGPDQLGSLLLIALLRDVTCQKKERIKAFTSSILFAF